MTRKICFDCGQWFEDDNDKMCLCEECRKQYKAGLFSKGQKVKVVRRIFGFRQPYKLFFAELIGFLVFAVGLAIYLVFSVLK